MFIIYMLYSCYDYYIYYSYVVYMYIYYIKGVFGFFGGCGDNPDFSAAAVKPPPPDAERGANPCGSLPIFYKHLVRNGSTIR